MCISGVVCSPLGRKILYQIPLTTPVGGRESKRARAKQPSKREVKGKKGTIEREERRKKRPVTTIDQRECDTISEESERY